MISGTAFLSCLASVLAVWSQAASCSSDQLRLHHLMLAISVLACCCLYSRQGLPPESSLVVASQRVACNGKQGGWSADSINLIPAQHTGHLVIVSVWSALRWETKEGQICLRILIIILRACTLLSLTVYQTPALVLNEGSHQTESSSLHHCTENLSSPAKL